jgi:flavorubredoxin
MANGTATSVDEIADGIYRISTPVDLGGGRGFTFNQFLIKDDQPLLYHTGQHKLFEETRAAVERVMPASKLRWISFSHYEADECGALNDFLALAPEAEPLCGRLAANTSINDTAIRPARVATDGETISLGRHTVRWFDTPHTPHAWECGLISETSTKTLFCGDLFTRDGRDHPAFTESDILGPSEALRQRLGYFVQSTVSRPILERLAGEKPEVMACMHGSSWRGDGAGLLRALADSVGRG